MLNKICFLFYVLGVLSYMKACVAKQYNAKCIDWKIFLLKEYDLSKSFWLEQVRMYCYVKLPYMNVLLLFICSYVLYVFQYQCCTAP